VVQTTLDRMKKKGEISRLRRENESEQGRLDQVLKRLGEQARASNLAAPALSEEMSALKSLEGERESAQEQIAGLEQQKANEHAQFAQIESERQAAVSAADEAIHQRMQQLVTKVGE